MNKQRGLGRGLGALLSSTHDDLSAATAERETLLEIPIDQVHVNPNQPRKLFDSSALQELASSIQA